MNNVSGVNAYQKSVETVKAEQINNKTSVKPENTTNTEKTATEAVKYEKNKALEGLSTYDRTGKPLNPETIEKMKQEAEMHYSNMIETIKQMIVKQGSESGAKINTDFLSKINQDKFMAEGVETSTDINDPNNYWSAEQTSDRIVEFAKQISGGDTSKYEQLKAAIEKGFEAAAGYFKEMPDITSKTHDMVMQKLDEWAGKSEVEETQAIS